MNQSWIPTTVGIGHNRHASCWFRALFQQRTCPIPKNENTINEGFNQNLKIAYK